MLVQWRHIEKCLQRINPTSPSCNMTIRDLYITTVITIIVIVAGASTLFRVLRYVTTPLLRRMGIYRYWSPLFLTQRFGSRTLEMHLGTSWDFLRQRDLTQRRLLRHVSDGLMALLDEAEAGRIPWSFRLRGTMSFLTEKTSRSLGFTTRRPNALEWLAFALNWPELCLLHSVARKRLSFVDIRRVHIIHATIGDLLSMRPRLSALTSVYHL